MTNEEWGIKDRLTFLCGHLNVLIRPAAGVAPPDRDVHKFHALRQLQLQNQRRISGKATLKTLLTENDKN